jgi:acetyl esterase/lipase
MNKPRERSQQCGPGVVETPLPDQQYPAYRGERAIRLFRPEGELRPRGAIVLFHAGDFSNGSIDAAAALALALARRLQVAVVVPDYTRACECPFPAAAEDAYAAVQWTHAQARKGGWHTGSIVVAGEEAGGNLATVAALMCRDRGGPLPVAQVLVSPMLDPSLSSRGMQFADREASSQRCAEAYRRYLPHVADRLHPYAAPLQCQRLAGIAPALVLSAADDALREEAAQYGAALIAAGVTTQVARLPSIRTADGGWTEETWAAIGAFVLPRLTPSHSTNTSHSS